MKHSITAQFNPDVPYSAALLGIRNVEQQSGATGVRDGRTVTFTFESDTTADAIMGVREAIEQTGIFLLPDEEDDAPFLEEAVSDVDD